jgi:hypothetical protein
MYETGTTNVFVPVTFQATLGVSQESFAPTARDEYVGTLTDLGMPVQSSDQFRVDEDYTAASGEGAGCLFDYTATTS